MHSKKELYDIVLDTHLTRFESMGKQSANNRQLPYYGKLKHIYPKHFSAFSHLKAKYECGFEKNLDGFIEFLIDLGDIPQTKSTIAPRISTINQEKGYIKGNMMWDVLRKSYKPIENKNKIATQNQQKLLIDFLVNTSFNTQIYLTNELTEQLGYSSFYTLERSLKKLNYTIYKDASGYFIQTQRYQRLTDL